MLLRLLSFVLDKVICVQIEKEPAKEFILDLVGIAAEKGAEGLSRGAVEQLMAKHGIEN